MSVEAAARASCSTELIYYPYTTEDGTAEGRKQPQPDAVVGTSITDLGADPEASQGP